VSTTKGGRVQRFRSGGFTHLPPMRALGELCDARRHGRGAMDAAAAACGYVLGAELRACGVDLSFYAGAGPGLGALRG
jgi:beta-N-acetylhexosaminidase